MSNKITKGQVLVFSAPSGSGKTTLLKGLFEEFPEFIFSISATTRKKREEEIEGKDYFFLSEEKFLSKIEKDEFIEWEKFYDYYYGTPKEFVDKKIKEGKTVILELDVKGALSIRNNYPDAKLFFIAPPTIAELKERLIKRNTETEADLEKRIKRAEFELGQKEKFDFIIINDNLTKAKEELRNIIARVVIKEM